MKSVWILNQRVPGSSPDAPTTQSSQTSRFQDDPHSGSFCGDLRAFHFLDFGLCKSPGA